MCCRNNTISYMIERCVAEQYDCDMYLFELKASMKCNKNALKKIKSKSQKKRQQNNKLFIILKNIIHTKQKIINCYKVKYEFASTVVTDTMSKKPDLMDELNIAYMEMLEVIWEADINNFKRDGDFAIKDFVNYRFMYNLSLDNNYTFYDVPDFMFDL
jgi:hypothetical protein